MLFLPFWKKSNPWLLCSTTTTPLILPDNAKGVETQLALRPYDQNSLKSSDTWDEFHVVSYTKSDGWNEHCRGLISPYHRGFSGVEGDRETRHEVARNVQALDEARAVCNKTIDPARLYITLGALGLVFQGAFHCVEDAIASGRRSLGHIRILDTASVVPGNIELPHVIHPSMLDGCTQMTSPALIEDGMLQVPMIPTSIEMIKIAIEVPNGAGGRLLEPLTRACKANARSKQIS
ncbi:MAG: hypothetical protein Q9188_001729 [Gyalolechia gomerana]